MIDRETFATIELMTKRKKTILKISKKNKVPYGETFSLVHEIREGLTWRRYSNGFIRKKKIEQITKETRDYDNNGYFLELNKKIGITDPRTIKERKKFAKDVELRLTNLLFTKYDYNSDKYYEEIAIYRNKLKEYLANLIKNDAVSNLEKIVEIPIYGLSLKKREKLIKKTRKKLHVYEKYGNMVKIGSKDYNLSFFRNPFILTAIMYDDDAELCSISSKKALNFWSRYKRFENMARRSIERHGGYGFIPMTIEPRGTKINYSSTFKEKED